jgi:hypothetical protein
MLLKDNIMTVTKKPTPGNKDDKQCEEPLDPESASDTRDREQVVRLYEEAHRRKDNLTEKDHIDKEKKK